MVIWVGGFAALLAVIGSARDRRALVVRFGRVAAASVAVLILSGGVLALVHLRTPADLLLSSYGVVLAVKLVAVVVALWLASFACNSSAAATTWTVSFDWPNSRRIFSSTVSATRSSKSD